MELLVKFKIITRAHVHQYKFPICLAYAITLHKSQGLSLPNALLDVGNSTFSCRQAYVALSRVKSLQGVHLINFYPCQMKAKESANVEYNYLRTLYRSENRYFI
jgi:ATP-dependent exoDNAse (exonuclease V) alpha subunit